MSATRRNSRPVRLTLNVPSRLRNRRRVASADDGAEAQVLRRAPGEGARWTKGHGAKHRRFRSHGDERAANFLRHA